MFSESEKHDLIFGLRVLTVKRAVEINFTVVHKCQRHSVLNSVFGKKDCFTKNKSAM